MTRKFKSSNHYRQYKIKLKISRKNRFLNRRTRSRLNQKHNSDFAKSYFDKKEQLVVAILCARITLVKKLLSEGLDPNYITDHGSPLAIAVWCLYKYFNYEYNNYKIEDIEYIKQHKINEFLQKTCPIIYMRIRLLIFAMLIKSGADVNYRDKKNNTSIHYPYKMINGVNHVYPSNRSESRDSCGMIMIDLLNKHKVILDNVNKDHDSQIMLAAENCCLYGLELCIRRGVNINENNSYVLERFSLNTIFDCDLRRIRYALNAGAERFSVYDRFDYVLTDLYDSSRRSNEKLTNMERLDKIITNFPAVRCLFNLCLSAIFFQQVSIP